MITPDNKFLLTGGSDKMLKQWDLGSQTLLKEYEKCQDYIMALATTVDAAHVFGGDASGNIMYWSVKEQKQVKKLKKNHDSAITCMNIWN